MASDDDSDIREWVRGVWDEWFEEVFAQSPESSEQEEEEAEKEDTPVSPEPAPDKK